ncbi:DoxX family protein [Amycolatopsis sp.]|uniref:DoxX family protein n=1 Tax=Amycolatopsis sp. TaxID=37632 RepID=UPI002B634933|nr:DoxX family protein [Amycolatopsis sp.]HVV08877.1 DoxX family protein [Amycolatopsis sp.]
MYLGYIIVGALLAAVLLSSAAAKLTKAEMVVDSLTGIGVSLKLFPFLAGCEIAGAAGLVAGIWWAPLGIAAAVGVVLYFVGAVGAHLRKRDLQGAQTPAVYLIFGIAALVLRVVSL